MPELAYADIRRARSRTPPAPRSAGPAARSSAASSRKRRPPSGSRRSARYLEDNDYEKKEVEKRSLDKYFSALKAGKPQIFNVYWSKPQVQRAPGREPRRDPLLPRPPVDNYEGVFDPDLQCAYADRVRRRQPGDKTLGLSPHMDAGTVERWIDPGYQRVYEQVFAGDWKGYDPFDGTPSSRDRARSRRRPSPRVFRTYQGWTALTRQGPKDGTLRLIPIAEGISYVLLRALAGRRAGGRSLRRRARPRPRRPPRVARRPDGRHGLDPRGMPGDTVWWHTDICHSVADEHAGKEYASVIYIGSAPDCTKNRAYLPGQKAAFLAGKSPPDFAPMNFEVDFKGRATEADLTDLGRKQMGF